VPRSRPPHRREVPRGGSPLSLEWPYGAEGRRSKACSKPCRWRSGPQIILFAVGTGSGTSPLPISGAVQRRPPFRYACPSGSRSRRPSAPPAPRRGRPPQISCGRAERWCSRGWPPRIVRGAPKRASGAHEA
jgi:hypothetical protein